MLTLPPAPLRRALRIATIVTLLVGYADLVRGGVSIGPLLLVLGYLVLVPAVLLTD